MAVLAVVARLAWGTLTLEKMMKPELEDGVGADIAGGDRNVGGSMKVVTRMSPSCSSLDHDRRERVGVGGDEDRGYLVATVDL